MFYRNNTDLPSSIRRYLPDHAQDIYRGAFNRAYAAYAGESDREVRAHMVAWSVVKRDCDKDEGMWVPNRVPSAPR